MTTRTRLFARARHAFREIAFIVVGVLLALGADSWLSNRRERELGEGYVVQLVGELETNKSILQAAVAEDSTREYAARGLFEGLREPNPMADSIRIWMKADPIWYSDYRLLMGTFSALIDTGEIRLIADARLRSAVVAYMSLITADLQEMRDYVDLQRTAVTQLRAIGEAQGISPFSRTSSAAGAFDPAQIERLIEAWPRFQANAEARTASGTLMLAKQNRLFYLRRMLEETESLLALLQSGRGVDA